MIGIFIFELRRFLHFCFISEIWFKNPTCFAFIFDASSGYDKVQKRRCLYSDHLYSVYIVTSHLEALSEDIRIFQKFLEYVVLYKHRLFCTVSYPEDASKINAKHVGFSNQISINEAKMIGIVTLSILIHFRESEIWKWQNFLDFSKVLYFGWCTVFIEHSDH